MITALSSIAGHMYASFLHIWPYLIITIPTALAIRMFDGTQYLTRAFRQRPMLAILAATLVGAVSPFCSCGVIPIIASLLIGGVPLAPVMSFWIASPSMDPEMFFLSVSVLGWELAIWRLLATLILSLGAGFLTHYLVKQGWIREYLRETITSTARPGSMRLLRTLWKRLIARISWNRASGPALAIQSSGAGELCCPEACPETDPVAILRATSIPRSGMLPVASLPVPASCECACSSGVSTTAHSAEKSKWRKLPKEAIAATLMVTKFMALAFLIEALITLYVPAGWIEASLGSHNHSAILWSTLIGIPAYTSNLTALPMIAGLIGRGMDPAAALAFLIAGPTTTLPAVAAVWGLVTKRVFALYLGIVLVGSLLMGYAYLVVHLVH